MTARSAAEIAWAMAALAQEFNYATMPHEGYPGLREPADVYSIAGAFRAMGERLPQGHRQVGQWLREQDAAGLIGHAQGRDAHSCVLDTRAGFEEMESADDALLRGATVAHNSSTWLKGAGQ